MTEEKKKKIRRWIVGILLGAGGLFVAYLIYAIAAKNMNTTIFNVLVIVLLALNVVLCDIAEPCLTGHFKEIDAYQKGAYKHYLFWDIAAMTGIFLLVVTISGEGLPLVALAALMLFSSGTKKKREYHAIFYGSVTKEDVEAAREAAQEE